MNPVQLNFDFYDANRTDDVLRVPRAVETLLAEISCAQDRDEVCDLARRADETISALHRTIDRERLNEQLADAVGERLQHFTADDPRAPAMTLGHARGAKSHVEKNDSEKTSARRHHRRAKRAG